MRSETFSKIVVASIATVLIIPSTLFIAPRPVYALVIPITDAINPPALFNYVRTAYGVVQETLTQINTFTAAAAEYATIVNTYILQPLAFVLSGQLMKALTASVMKFVIGQANATGIPQFTVDIQKSLRSISDFQAQAYFRQVSLTNSPFAASIAQALNINYNQSTSLAGYWAQNLCTLGKNIPTYSPNFINGSWAQGGTAAWFQLTTQDANNPYMLFQNSQAKLATVIGSGVGGGSGARLAQLSWGQGFMSWCGASDTATQNAAAAYASQQACIDQGNSPTYCDHVFADSGGAAGGVNPGDPCTKSDGTAGTIQTPGSTIKATLDKVLGGQQDKLVQMGNISGQVNSILGNIGTVLNTINLAANILGGNQGGGLLNAGSPSGALTQWGSPSASSAAQTGIQNGNYFGTTLSQAQNSPTASEVAALRYTDRDAAIAAIPRNANADGLDASTTTSGMPARVELYRAAWAAIADSASTTKAVLQTEISVCHAYLGRTSSYENDAQNALSFSVIPVLVQAANIETLASAALTQDALVQGEATSSPTYADDVQKLNTMPPTASDVANAKYNATAYGGATANPAGSLTVSGGSIVDKMNLIRNNAINIQALACTAQTGDHGGGG